MRGDEASLRLALRLGIRLDLQRRMNVPPVTDMEHVELVDRAGDGPAQAGPAHHVNRARGKIDRGRPELIGALTRVKGGTRAAPFPVAIEAQVPGEGVVILTATSSSEGCATKSLEAICIRAKAALNSRLASPSTAALLTLSNALPTSVSPLVNARPLARKPTTGITAMAAMRLRTESFEMSCCMSGIDLAMAICLHGGRVFGRSSLRQYQG